MADVQSVAIDGHSEVPERPHGLSSLSPKDLLEPAQDKGKLAQISPTHQLPSLEFYDSSAQHSSAKPDLVGTTPTALSANHLGVDSSKLPEKSPETINTPLTAPEVAKQVPEPAESALSQPPALLDRANQPELVKDMQGDIIDKPQLASLWNPDDKVLAIGDMHSTDDIKKYFEDNLAALHAAGAKSVGFEFLPQHLQKDVDEYCDLKNRQEKGEPLIAKEQERLDSLTKELKDNLNPDSEGPQGQTQERLMQMIDAIRRSGMRVLCVEPDLDHPFDKGSGYALLHEGMQALGPGQQAVFDNYLDSPAGAKGHNEARDQLHDRLKEAGWDEAKISKFLTSVDDAQKAGMKLDKLDQDNKQWSDTVQNFRNESWAKVIASTPGRIVMFAGAGHFGYGDASQSNDGKTLNERLKERGIGTTVIQFASKRSPVNEGPSIAQQYNDAATQLRMTKEQFGLKLKGRSRIGDYVIHLPQ